MFFIPIFLLRNTISSCRSNSSGNKLSLHVIQPLFFVLLVGVIAILLVECVLVLWINALENNDNKISKIINLNFSKDYFTDNPQLQRLLIKYGSLFSPGGVQ